MPEVGEEQRTEAVGSADAELLERLRAGDERAFESLVVTHHAAMVALARTYVKSHAVAEEVVQEAWLGVLKGLDRFEGRSSLKTWIMRIVVNGAITRGGRERRSLPFSAMASAEDDPVVEPERFRPRGGAFAGHWAGYPSDWRTQPEERLLGEETIDVVRRAIDELPESQRLVITMRDVAGCSADEACSVLDLSAANQRVLLHRARSRVRAALEGHLSD